jgi:diacylglycerol kinase (ATP)
LEKGPSNEKILFIINPISGRRNKTLLTGRIKRYIDLSRYEPILEFTRESGDADRIVKKYSKKGIKKMVAVGGDGTVNEVARAIAVRKHLVMGIIPAGSGNGLARHLDIPIRVKKAMELINDPKIVDIDYGLMNKVPFFCTCGVGFDAAIGNRFAEGTARGFFAYVIAAFREYILFKPSVYKIEGDSKPVKTKAFLITCANASQYGNNAFISPNANIQDGLLDVVVISPFPYMRAISLGFRLFSKSIYRFRYHTTFRTEKLVIRRKKAGDVHFDGEPGQMKKKIVIRVVKAGLRVMVSPESSLI